MRTSITFVLFTLSILCSCFADESTAKDSLEALKTLTQSKFCSEAILDYDRGRAILHGQEYGDCSRCEKLSLSNPGLNNHISHCYSDSVKKYTEDLCEQFAALNKKISLGDRKENNYRYQSYSRIVFSLKNLLSEVIVPSEINGTLVKKLYDGQISVSFETKDRSIFRFIFQKDSQLIEPILANTQAVTKQTAEIYVDFNKDGSPYVLGKTKTETLLEVKDIDEILNLFDGAVIAFQDYTPVDGWFIISGEVLEK